MLVDGDAWVAKPRERRVRRVKLRASILRDLAASVLMTEERENEVTEIAVHTTVIISTLRVECSRQNNSLVASVLSENHERAESLRLNGIL